MTWLSVAELQRTQGWTPEQVYWFARRDKWRRTKTRPRGYHLDDVTDTIEREASAPT